MFSGLVSVVPLSALWIWSLICAEKLLDILQTLVKNMSETITNLIYEFKVIVRHVWVALLNFTITDYMSYTCENDVVTITNMCFRVLYQMTDTALNVTG